MEAPYLLNIQLNILDILLWIRIYRFALLPIYWYNARSPYKTMNEIKKKLKMNVRGTFHRLWADIVMKKKMRKLGLSPEKISHCNIHHTEVIVSGDPKELWKVVELAKTPSPFLKMDAIYFEFID